MAAIDDDELKPLDPAYVEEILSNPPFVPIPGVCNVRDLGSYPTATPNVVTKPDYVYRSADISRITEEGVQNKSTQTSRASVLKPSS